MGEIADALRRAQLEDAKAAGTASTRPPPSSARPRDPLPRAAPATASLDVVPVESPVATRARGSRQEVRLHPAERAIVLDEGPNLEVCRQLAVRLRSMLEKAEIRSAAIVSAMRNEGKSVVLCDLGLALASISSARDVAIVDLDLRNPSIANFLDLPVERGVDDVLLGRATLDDVRFSAAQPELDVYPIAAPQRASHELLSLPSFARMVEELESRYRIVLFDTPPVLLVPDASLILRHVSAAIPIARAGQTRVRAFRRLVDQLPPGRILCELLNGTSELSADQYYYGVEPPKAASDKKQRFLSWGNG